MTTQRDLDMVHLRLILVSGKTQDFTFSPNDSATDIAKHVFDNWPAGWEEEQSDEQTLNGRKRAILLIDCFCLLLTEPFGLYQHRWPLSHYLHLWRWTNEEQTFNQEEETPEGPREKKTPSEA